MEEGTEAGGGAGRGGFDYARAWRCLAYALFASAAVLVYTRRTDAAFFAAALGASAWFLNVRTGLKRKHDLVRDGGRNWRPRNEVEARDTEEEEEP